MGASVMSPEEELAALIAEQEKDMRTGDRVFSVSLNAERNAWGGGQLLHQITEGEDGYAVLPRGPTRSRHVLVNDPRHGLNGYTNLGCRCPKCKAANTAAQRIARERRSRGIAGRGGHIAQHGTYTRYHNWKCRCDLCKEAAYEHAVRKGYTSGARSKMLIVKRFAAVVSTTSANVGLPFEIRSHHAYKKEIPGMCEGYLSLGPRFAGRVRCSRRAKPGTCYCGTHAKKVAAAA